jgi:thiamine biosynthesis lipoprotein
MPMFGFRFSAMACDCEVRVAAVDEAAASQMAEQVKAEVRRIQAKFSRFDPGSVLSQINANAGLAWTACDDETCQLLDYADALFSVSSGLFDITSGVLQRCWDFRHGRLPEEAALAQARTLVGWQQVERKGSSIYLPRLGMELDFGGFGKEYAVDRGAEILRELGVEAGFINLGGDLQFLGPQPDGSPWLAGIRDPRIPGQLCATIPIYSGALATSGDYERYFDYQGVRYCHILHPGSGMPVEYWRSVSVLAPLALAAGSYSTIAMLKQEAGLEFLQTQGTGFLAIDRSAQVYCDQLAGPPARPELPPLRAQASRMPPPST